MYVVNIKKLLNNKLTLVIFCVIVIVVILSIIIYTLSMKLNILRGTKIGDILSKLGNKNNVLNMESYYAEFELTVISNKNTNTYFIKEWYKKDIGSRLEYLDKNNSKINISIFKDKMIIKNEGQKSIMNISSYLTSYTNVISLSTFVKIYNISVKEKYCFEANSYEKVNEINIVLDNICKNKNECICEDHEIVKQISKMELRIDKNNHMPLTYTLYDNDKKECISIVYNKFDINAKMLDTIFEV